MFNLVLTIIESIFVLLGIAFTVELAAKRRKRLQEQSLKFRLIRITHLEYNTGMGIYWALDRDILQPTLTRPALPGWSLLLQYAFICHGCGEEVIYADYDGEKMDDVRDKRKLFCNSCLPADHLLLAKLPER